MHLKREQNACSITFDDAEIELLRLALARATFEDTPPERQQQIVEFALALQRALGG